MLDGREGEIDIEVGPAKVVGAGSLDGCDLPYRGVREPRELLERHQQVATVDVQPESNRGDLANLDGRNGLPTQRGFHLRSPLDQPKRRLDLTVTEAIILRELHVWFQPELCLSVGMLHVHMRPRLLAREEVEPVSADPKNRGAHAESSETG